MFTMLNEVSLFCLSLRGDQNLHSSFAIPRVLRNKVQAPASSHMEVTELVFKSHSMENKENPTISQNFNRSLMRSCMLCNSLGTEKYLYSFSFNMVLEHMGIFSNGKYFRCH